MQRILNKPIFLGFLSSIILIILDQITKYFAVLKLKDAPAIPIITDVFELEYLENRGAAFGILQGQKTFFVILTIIMLIIMIYLYIHLPLEKHFGYMRIILILLISGAIGNFIDRCMNNYVVDFFYFKLINFPIFNVADIYVSVATVALVLLFLFYYKEEDIDIMLNTFPFRKKKELQ